MQKHLLFILIALCCVVNLRAADYISESLSGTYQVGNSQTYKKLADVANELNKTGVAVTGNVVFELGNDYDGTTGETFPIVFNQFVVSGGNWTVTIRPKAGVAMRTTSGDPGTQALIQLNGSDRIIFDGRAGGTGEIAWLIRNTATSNAGATFLLENDAQKNTLTFLQLEGQTLSAGVVHIGTSGAGGNDDNTISYCTIRDRSDVSTPARPVAGILSQGSATSTGIQIDHNNIFNFYNNGGIGYGIRMTHGTTAASILFNSIYQTEPLLNAAPGTRLYGIAVNELKTTGITIGSNYIGGSAPECGGTPLTLASATGGHCVVRGISYGVLNAPFAEGNTCSYNTIRNIDVTNDGDVPSMSGIFTGIFCCANIDVLNNTIGNPDAHDAIRLTVGDKAVYSNASMIFFEGVNLPVVITGNRMGGVTVSGKGIVHSDLTGIYGNSGGGPVGGTTVISDNVIGSTTIPDNFRVISKEVPMIFSGILYGNNVEQIICENNTVAGVSLSYPGTTVPIRSMGIQVTSGRNLSVKNNLVSGISSASLAPFAAPTDDSYFWDFCGINAYSIGDVEVSGNIIKGLHLTGTAPINAPSGMITSITGIAMGAGQRSAAYNNKVYDLVSANDLGPSSATLLTGIRLQNDMVVYNNLVSLDNGGLSNNCEISGLVIVASSGPRFDTLYHNTIYTGGSNGISSNTAFSAPIAYHHFIGKGSGKAYFTMRNNLLVNGRTGGDGSHYLFQNQTPDDNWTVAASDTNVLVIADPGRVGRWGNADLDSAQWKATGGDVHSWIYSTAQVGPAALFSNAMAGDLTIRTGARKYVAGKGIPSGIVTDYAATPRNTTAPTIGAYEYEAVVANTAPVVTSYGGNIAVTLQVPENTTAVASVAATDADALTYSLAGGEDAAKFSVDPSTGELRFITAPDFEQPVDANGDNAYIVTVQVSDGDSVAVQRFKVKITDANDHAPVITSYNGDFSVTLRVPENSMAVVATVKATDVDRSATLAYSLTNEEDAGKFTVNGSTGELNFITVPDFDQPGDNNRDNVYIVTVKASDGDSSATQRFKVKVTDLNDNTPVFISHNGDAVVNIQLPENTIIVDTVSAADGDSTGVMYSIENGNDGALFSVSASGVLSFIMPPDYDHPGDAGVDNRYIVSVKASDGTLSAIQQYIITITDLNDNPPMATMTINVPENTVEVTQLEGTDDDAGSTVVFTLMDQEDGTLFWINPANGMLEFKTAPDFENPADADHDNLYLVSVKMTAGELITILRFKVKVNDTNGAAARTTGRTANQPEVQSTVVLQMEEKLEPAKVISVYPNPVTGKQFNLRMNGSAAGRYILEIYTTAGQLVCRQQLNHTGKSVVYPVQLPASLARGSYVLKLTGIDTRHTEKLIIQ